VLIFYVLLFGILYLACAISRKIVCKISENVGRTPWQWLVKSSGKIAWAVHRKYKLTDTEKGEKVKNEAESMLIIFFNINEIQVQGFRLTQHWFEYFI
jgi:hypothetical protein